MQYDLIINSDSDAEVFYTIKIYNEDNIKISCSCLANQNKSLCKHIIRIIEKKYESIDEKYHAILDEIYSSDNYIKLLEDYKTLDNDLSNVDNEINKLKKKKNRIKKDYVTKLSNITK
jgi:hypothetical protein